MLCRYEYSGIEALLKTRGRAGDELVDIVRSRLNHTWNCIADTVGRSEILGGLKVSAAQPSTVVSVQTRCALPCSSRAPEEFEGAPSRKSETAERLVPAPPHGPREPSKVKVPRAEEK